MRTSYVLNHFDGERIFQRSFFRDLQLPPKPDEKILQETGAKSEDSLATLQEKISTLEKLDARLNLYQKRIARHVARLEKYRRAIEQKGFVDEAADISELRQKYRDALSLLMRYTNKIYSKNFNEETTVFIAREPSIKILVDGLATEVSENLRELYREERFFYRRIFAERLKAARQERGLTAKALAEQVGIPRPNVSDYEKMRYEPNLAVQVKFAQVLKKPVGWFLGME